MRYARRPMRLEDYDALIPPERQDPEARKIVAAALDAGEAFAAFDMTTGQVVLGAGAVLTEPGIAAIWLVPSEAIKEHPIAMARLVHEFAREVVADHKLRRAETIVNPDDPKAVRFAEWLGMEKEGRLRCRRRDGGPMDMYSIICPENV